MAGEDREYVGWVKRQKCRMAAHGGCQGGIEAHHAGLDRGLSQRAHDSSCIPLCTYHHRCWHDASGPFKTFKRAERCTWSEDQIIEMREKWEMRGYARDFMW
jgi:hypothetical protein